MFILLSLLKSELVYCIVLHYIVLHSITLHCIVLYCIAFMASNCFVLLYSIVLELLPLRGNNLCKLRPQNKILVPLRGSFQNLRRSLLSLLYESPPGGGKGGGGGQKHPEFGLNFSLNITKKFERPVASLLCMALVSDSKLSWFF